MENNPFDIFEQIYESHDNGEISDEEMVFLCESAEEKLGLIQESFFGIGGAVESGGNNYIKTMGKKICEYASKAIKDEKEVSFSEIKSIISDIGKKVVDIVGDLRLSQLFEWSAVCKQYFGNGSVKTLSTFFSGTLPNIMDPYVKKCNEASSHTDKYSHIKKGVSALEAEVKKASTMVGKHYAQFFKDHKDAKNGSKSLGDKIISITNKHVSEHNKKMLPEKVNGKSSIKNALRNAKSTLTMARDISKDVKSSLKPNPNRTITGIANLDIDEEFMRKELQKPKKNIGSGSDEKPQKRELAKPTGKAKLTDNIGGSLYKSANSNPIDKRTKKELKPQISDSVMSPYHKGKFKNA